MTQTISDLGVNLTPKQQAELNFSFAQDTDLWLVVLDQYIASKGELSEWLKSNLLNNTEEWQELVKQNKKKGLEDIKALASGKTAQWNLRIGLLLSDLGHVNILRFYLKALVAMKSKRVADVGARAQARKQINTIISAMANDAYSTLDKMIEARSRVQTGKSLGGKPISDEVRVFYEVFEKENLSHIASLMAIILLFKSANRTEDIVSLQKLIRNNIVAPLEARLPLMTDEDDIQRLRSRIKGYDKLIQAVDISFD